MTENAAEYVCMVERGLGVEKDRVRVASMFGQEVLRHSLAGLGLAERSSTKVAMY